MAGDSFDSLVNSARSVLPAATSWEVILAGVIAIILIVWVGYPRMKAAMFGGSAKVRQQLDVDSPLKSTLGFLMGRVIPDEVLPSFPGFGPIEGELKYKVYLNTSHAERERAKVMGAKWDNGARAWYIPPGLCVEPFLEYWEINSTLTRQSAAQAKSA